MRNATEDEELEWTVAEWKDDPETVLKEVDHVLQSHGLEVVVFEGGTSDICFSIDKRKET